MNKKPLNTNAADEDQLHEAKENLRNSEQRSVNRWKKALEDDQFCALLFELMDKFHMDESPVANADHFETHRRIGMQAAGRHIKKKMIEANKHKFYEQLLKLEEVKR